MTYARSFRRIEIALWFTGIALLGLALWSTVNRWSYQEQQERALFQGGPAVSVAAPLPVAVNVPPVVPKSVEQAPAAPVVSAAKTKKARRSPAVDPSAIGRIEIPRLRVAAIVREGADKKTLERAVGHVPGSARPGESGNMVLAAHRDTFFRPLRRIRVNDRIRVVVPPNTYEYRVESLRVVEPDETDVLASNGVEELTLITCYPFRFIGPAPERFVVSAARVN
jgi:sortase A